MVMKKYLVISTLTIVIFGALTILTSKNGVAFDGNDAYGFPFIFFTKLGGKRLPGAGNGTEFFYFKLLLDIIVALLIAMIIWFVFLKLKKMTGKKSEAARI
jgi:hypothetical protein